jgi:signal transduction histidine kinase
MKIIRFIIVNCLLLFAVILCSFAQKQGDYFFRNFSARDLKSSDWIQSIVRDNRGVIYAGNNIGTILEYDGTVWRSIQATNGPIRALKADSSGRIYVGSLGEFGFLEPGPGGEMHYKSFLDRVNQEDKNISDIWSIEIFGDDIYFRSVERLFRLRNGKITAFTNPYGWFGNLISLDDQLYVTIDSRGIILRMEGDSLVKFFESNEYASVVFGASADYTENKKLVGSWGGGIFIFCPENRTRPGGKVLERFTSSSPYINRNLERGAEVYAVDKDIFAARTDNGVALFDRNGTELGYISTANGLNSSLIEVVYSDRNQFLWIGTEKGITRVDISSPITSFYSFNELTGTTWGIISYNEIIYFWSVRGIFLIRNNKAEIVHDENAGLVKFSEPGKPLKTHLLAVNYNSLIEIRGNKPVELLTFPTPLLYQQVYISKSNPDRLYLFCANGLYLIRYNNGKWKWEGNVAGITEGIQSLSEDRHGDLWLVINNYKRLIHLKPELGKDSLRTSEIAFGINYYDPPEFVSAKWIRCFNLNNRVLFGTDKGLFGFDERTRKFIPDSTLGSQFSGGSHGVFILREGPEGVVFIAGQLHQTDDIGLCIPRPDGTYSWYTRPFTSLTPQMRIYDAGFESDGSIWIASDEGLSKYDPGNDRKAQEKFHTLVREVITRKDSVLFRGTFFGDVAGPDEPAGVKVPALIQPDFMKPVLPYRFNSLKFNYSAVSFEQEDQHVYQYMLEGFDEEWSNWTTASSKEYSNLPEGKFTFRVKGKNAFGIEGDEARYQFTILPPWYRTLWSYLGYLLVAGLLIYLIVVYNLRRLKATNIILEESVKQRTAEVVRQKEEIVTINENLLLRQEELKTTLDNLCETQAQLIQSEKMASLGQLIAGIAHEINTPLGAIKASVSEITGNSRQILMQLPELIKNLQDDHFSLFMELVKRSTQIVIPLNSKDSRNYKKILQKQLEERGIADAAYKADMLADMGIYDNIDPFMEILELSNEELLPAAYHLSQLVKNSQNIKMAIDRASKIVYALKNYSYKNNREEKIEADITEGIITVLTLYQNQLKHGVHLKTEFEPLPRIFCYPDELTQVWTNLITNAMDAMEGKGELILSVSRVKDSMVIKISDSGSGIPAHVQPRIFDAFFSTKEAGEGSGLGLFIVKEIIDKHSGKISFETTEGHGTTFTIMLPMITRSTNTLTYDSVKKSDPMC